MEGLRIEAIDHSTIIKGSTSPDKADANLPLLLMIEFMKSMGSVFGFAFGLR